MIQAKCPQHVLGAHAYRDQETVLVRREGLLAVARLLRDDPLMRFDILMDVTCVDYLKFGRSQSSAPTLATPAPLPYYMQSKADAEPWDRGASHDQYRFDVVYHV